MGNLEQWAIVGLGNPGKRYAMTRHNLGFLVVERLARQWGISWSDERRFSARVGRGKVEDKGVHLLMPQTYMNESGRAVRRYMDFFGLVAQQIVVVCDDVALDFGEMRLRLQGSSGGHNGLKSVEAHLGTREYPRLRLGVGEGRSARSEGLVDHVLGGFSVQEREELDAVLEKASEALVLLVGRGIHAAMNEVNKRRKKGAPLGDQEKENEGT